MNCKSNGKSRFILLTAAIFLVVFECCGDDNTVITNIFGGSENVAIIANADSVKVWRTLGSVEEEQQEQGQNVHFEYPDFYRKTGKPVLVSTNLAAALNKLLLDKNSYCTIPVKNCRPDADVVVTFSHGDKSVNVFLCFECKALGVDDVPIPSYIDPGSEAILQVIKKIFPNDRKIQSLR